MDFMSVKTTKAESNGEFSSWVGDWEPPPMKLSPDSYWPLLILGR